MVDHVPLSFVRQRPRTSTWLATVLRRCVGSCPDVVMFPADASGQEETGGLEGVTASPANSNSREA